MRRALVTYDAGLPNGARRSKLPHELRALSPELAHLSDSRIYHYFHRVRG